MMRDDMMPMMWGMRLFRFLGLIIIDLVSAALINYLSSSGK